MPKTQRDLAPAAGVPTGLVEWTSMIDGHPVALSVELVNTLFKGSHPFTPQECFLFIQECKARGADPIAKDMYPIKYESGKPASFVTSYHFLMALAQRDPYYDGFNLWYVDDKGEKIPQGLETATNVIAAICRVKNKRRSPTEFVARLKEFNKGQAMWKSMPVHMLGKVAIAGAHRQVIGTAVHVAEEYGTTDEAVEVSIVPEALPAAEPDPEPERSPESPETVDAEVVESTPSDGPNAAEAAASPADKAPGAAADPWDDETGEAGVSEHKPLTPEETKKNWEGVVGQIKDEEEIRINLLDQLKRAGAPNVRACQTWIKKESGAETIKGITLDQLRSALVVAYMLKDDELA